MTFPVEIPLGPLRIHPHLLFELIAYTGGFQLYLLLRRRADRLGLARASTSVEANIMILVGAVFGALVGAKVLAWLESPGQYLQAIQEGNWLLLVGGKTVVGGVLGGWVGVEIAKHFMRVRHSTGDMVVFPLIFGMGVGRVGCFLTGLSDHTYGVATSLPWGVDFGDGVPRHPTQLYEIAFLVITAIALVIWWRGGRRVNGSLFRAFMLAYVLMRFAIEFIKPSPKPYLALSAIQCACLVAAIVCVASLVRLRPPRTMAAGPGTSPTTTTT